MIFESLPLEKPLAGCIATVFYLKDYSPEHELERLVPDTLASFVIELDGKQRWIADNESLQPIQRCQGSWLSGPQRNHLSISAVADTELLAVQFLAGGLYPFLNLPVVEFRDCVVPGTQVWGTEVDSLREMLTSQPESRKKLDLVASWLESQFDSERRLPPEVHNALNAIQTDPTQSTLAQATVESGFSKKHLIDLFKKHVGLTPKEFQRVVRFAKVLKTIEEDQRIDWASLSIDCGYFDQAHFVKDFKNFSGINPTKFMTQRGDRSNFFPIEDDASSDR